MLLSALAQVWAGMDAGDAHFSHMSLYCLKVDFKAFAAKLGCNPPGTIIWVFRVNFINAVLESNFLR